MDPAPSPPASPNSGNETRRRWNIRAIRLFTYVSLGLFLLSIIVLGREAPGYVHLALIPLAGFSLGLLVWFGIAISGYFQFSLNWLFKAVLGTAFCVTLFNLLPFRAAWLPVLLLVALWAWLADGYFRELYRRKDERLLRDLQAEQTALAESSRTGAPDSRKEERGKP
ncbi:MAG: hypothetical protein HY291_13540 [Planctomycetes bacterium]|nr:hypothetical protein [Planctomycetota bacterium]